MTEVLIVGAGPAGLSAAIACAEHGLEVRIVDEFVKPGGRLLGQLHQEPDGEWWNGIDKANRLLEKAKELGVKINCGVSVYDLERTKQGWRIFTTKEVIDVPVVLLATGAAESAVPIPGWTLPGVMSIGAVQVMTNVHRVRVGERGIVIGVNILSLAITRELQIAGIPVESMFLPASNILNEQAGNPEIVMQTLIRIAHLSPSRWIRIASKMMKSECLQKWGVRLFPKRGIKVWGIPIHLRKAAVEICGDGQVEGVCVADITSNGKLIRGTEKMIPADFVCIAGGLYPLAELAAVAGCPFRYVPELGGYVPIHNVHMQTPLKGLYVAGNITGIEGAKVAMAQGTVAGLSIVNDYTKLNHEEKLQHAIRLVEQARQQAVIQFHPEIQKGRQTLQQLWTEGSFHS